jgi:hypothetical protein
LRAELALDAGKGAKAEDPSKIAMAIRTVVAIDFDMIVVVILLYSLRFIVYIVQHEVNKQEVLDS